MKRKKAMNLDAIKAMRRGGREAEMELLGPGFHSFNRLHKSKKTYTRKLKHKLKSLRDRGQVRVAEGNKVQHISGH